MTPLEAALGYAARGWRVVPIIPGEKRPAIERWVEHASTESTFAHNWWGTGDYGVGIVTGHGSRIWVLDVDPKHSGDDTLADLERQYGPLPITVRALTPSGGEHIYFVMPDDWNPGTGANRLGPGLDVRAEGGQVVAPPTDGREWQHGFGPDEVEVSVAPEWLLGLLRAPLPNPQHTIHVVKTDNLPGTRWSNQTTWSSLLEADGATLMRVDSKGVEYWVRPGKDARDGSSATLHHNGNDCLRVFSSNWPGLAEGQMYTKLGYLAATRFGGDHQAAAEWCKGQVDWGVLGTPANPHRIDSPIYEVEEPEDEPLIGNRIDWATFWNRSDDDRPWLIEPFLVKGRAHALYAPAKQGKSYFLLWCLALATLGRPVLQRAAGVPIRVLYVDLEMTEDDVYQRLVEFGHEGAIFDHFAYHVMPPIPALDSVEGGQLIVAEAVRWGADLVVIDTMSRAIQGGENDSDTILAYARHTTAALKRAGIASLRLDHAGKDLERGQRGSSAKNDDVDIVWQQTLTDDGLVLKATHRRLSWVPEKMTLTMVAGDSVDFVMKDAPGYVKGTKEAVLFLDAIGVPVDISLQKAWPIAQQHDPHPARAAIRDAVKARKEGILMDGTPHGTPSRNSRSAQTTAHPDQTASDLDGTHNGTPRHTPSSQVCRVSVPLGTAQAQTVPETDLDDWKD